MADGWDEGKFHRDRLVDAFVDRQDLRQPSELKDVPAVSTTASGTAHQDYCLFVRDGGRSMCTCWPETANERAALKETTLNEIGLALSRNHEFIASVLGSLENRTMENQSWLSGMLFGWQSRVDNQHKELLHQFEILVSCQTVPALERLRHIESKQDAIGESLDKIISALIDARPEPFQPVRRATKKGKKR